MKKREKQHTESKKEKANDRRDLHTAQVLKSD